MMPTEADKRVAAVVIDKALRKKFLDITQLDKAIKLMGGNLSGPAYDRLSALHCINWGDIPPDVTALIPSWLNECMNGPQIAVTHIPALREGNVHHLGLEDQT